MGFRGNNKVLTKRQFMKSATAMGISAIGAHALTAKDVRGADSDQVAISMDGDDWVEYVPRDWFNRVSGTCGHALREQHSFWWQDF